MQNILLYLSDIFKGDNAQIYYFLTKEKEIDKEEINKSINKYETNKIKYLTLLDSEYPKDLFQDTLPPFVIYYKGNLKLLESKKKVIICNEIHNSKTKYFIDERLNLEQNDIVLVATDFKKTEQEIIDAQKTKGNHKIIWVHSQSLEQIPEAINENNPNELHLSLFPLNSHPKRNYFKQSNSLASAIANYLLILSSVKNTKLAGLINSFLYYGKEIYCFPGLTIDDGNTNFLKEGANLATTLSEIFEEN
ncbi:hypothetical protein [Mycoplasma hafezii]|uniref:hypothetical protein n=1 Tax=Mycoplasma hafezii TaxID=525886 RepID=UPI003CF6EC83